MITASGLVFIGAATDNFLRAFDLRSGKELWKGRLPAGPQATPMTYRVRPGGQQYVVIAAGGHKYLGILGRRGGRLRAAGVTHRANAPGGRSPFRAVLAQGNVASQLSRLRLLSFQNAQLRDPPVVGEAHDLVHLDAHRRPARADQPDREYCERLATRR